MTYTIIGGAGRTGHRVQNRLTSLGHAVRLASRRTAFDWDDRSTWRAAIGGTTAAYVVYSPDLAFPGVPEKMRALGTISADSGVERFVLLSGRGEEGALASEDALREAGLPTAVLRCSWFQQNFSEHFLLGPIRRGILKLPATDIPEAFVDLEDVADAAVVALTRQTPLTDSFELSGPDLLSFADVARIFTATLGREVVFERADVSEFADDMALDGVPREASEPLGHLFEDILDGRNAQVTDGVRQLLDREPGSLAAYVERTAATGVWS